MLVELGKEKLFENRHWQPMVVPYLPGGTYFQRYTPMPIEVRPKESPLLSKVRSLLTLLSGWLDSGATMARCHPRSIGLPAKRRGKDTGRQWQSTSLCLLEPFLLIERL